MATSAVDVTSLHKPSDFDTTRGFSNLYWQKKEVEEAAVGLVQMALRNGDKFSPFTEAEYLEQAGSADVDYLEEMVTSNHLSLQDGRYHFRALFLWEIQRYLKSPLRDAVMAEREENCDSVSIFL